MRIFLLALSFFALVPRVSAAVVVNEIFPKSADVTTTWIELYNTGPQPVSLDRWKLENNGGNSFVMNAGAIIAPNGFLTFYQNQSGLTFGIEGDTVRLFDDKNNLVESQSYPGTLGYNTAIGHSVDGGAGWEICSPLPEYLATPNKPNKCPPAPTVTATATATATHTPTKSPTPVPSSVPTTPTTTIDATSRFAYPDVLGDITTPTPIPTSLDVRQSNPYKQIWIFALIAGVGLGVLIMVIGLIISLVRDKKPKI